MADLTEEILKGRRVRLTPLQLENIHRHFEWNNDPELNRLDSEIPFVRESFGDFKERFEEMVFHPSTGVRDFEIHAEDDALIGVAYIMDLSPHNRHCLVGVTIGDRDRWGKHYGRESLEVLLDYCFNELELHRVATETFEYNTAWKQLVVEAGFSQEGTERDYLFREGQFWDKVVFSLLEPEYRERVSEHSMDRKRIGVPTGAG
ncbi:MAG TPA: GNAT family protein [Rhodothermales bacterium]|nr:GNAT family protein [Rhodothermales bacterium]